MNDLESGLFLPIRFYLQKTEQDRYKAHSVGVSLLPECFPHIDCKSLAPFQLNYNSEVLSDLILFYAYCANTEQINSLLVDSAHWNEHISNGTDYSLSYMGTDDFTGELNNGLYYFVVVVAFPDEITATYYSDLVMVSNCGGDSYDIEEYRVHSHQSGSNFRAIDATDLRITK